MATRNLRNPADAGVGIDAYGGGVIDPTKNVGDLVAAERILTNAKLDRQDDLRDAETRRIDDQIRLMWKHFDDISALRAHYDERLSKKESERIDAVRAVDANSVVIANERANIQATVLDKKVSDSAEALRADNQRQFNLIMDKIGALERSSYEGSGRRGVTDPQMGEMLTEIKALRLSSAQDIGRTGGGDKIIAYVIAGVSILIAVAAVAIPLLRGVH